MTFPFLVSSGSWNQLPYSGTYCERVDECVVDQDCGPSNGKCIDIRSANAPSRYQYNFMYAFRFDTTKT